MKLEYEYYAELYEKGYTNYQLAEMAGVNPTTMFRALKKLGVKMRKKGVIGIGLSRKFVRSKQREEEINNIAAFYKSGLSLTQTAEKLGISIGAVRYSLKIVGVSGRPPQCGIGKKPVHVGKFGADNPNYKGGIVEDKDGYIRVLGDGNRKLQHRIIAESVLGRPLRNHEVVHHINGDKKDNRNKNLLICLDSYHRIIHARENALDECGNPNYRKCVFCHEYDAPENMTVIKRNQMAYHKMCATKHQRELRR
jgi:DNA-binding CsgD family transcriptional regulator